MGWSALSASVRQYLLITANYWVFTLTDGALRMLVVLHFHQLGFAPLQIALLFLFYEVFGVITNLFGGWLGARIGLNRTMNLGLALQMMALLMLAVPAAQLTVPWVMGAQALSGIAKDLNKMSAKASVKHLVPAGAEQSLFRWVAVLTGSKNALKGAGFFLGGVLLSALGFSGAILALTGAIAGTWLVSLFALRGDLGRARDKPRFRDILSKSRAINVLSAARLFLFGARDIWFVVALPVFVSQALGWDYWATGALLAGWLIVYGVVQSLAPWLTGKRQGRVPSVQAAAGWAGALTLVPAVMAVALPHALEPVLFGGLALFGILFAINSSLHSYLIVSYADRDRVSLDVGFYYMANALGRLAGTVLSGWLFQVAGLGACLWMSAAFLALCSMITLALPRPGGAH